MKSFEEGFIDIKFKGFKDRLETIWKILRYGKISFPASAFRQVYEQYLNSQKGQS